MNTPGLPATRSWKTWFLRGTAAFLLINAGLKLLSVMSETPVLAARDPLLSWLTERQMLFAAALMEVSVAGALLRRGDVRRGAWLVLWLVAVFGAHRIGLKSIGFQGHCPCLGPVLAWLPGFASWSDPVMVGALAALGVGNLWVLATQAGPRGGDRQPSADPAPRGNRVRGQGSPEAARLGARTLVAVVLGVAGLSWPWRAVAFEVHGDLESISYGLDNTVSERRLHEFFVRVHEQQWYMHTREPTAMKERPGTGFEYDLAYDGQDMYYTIGFSPSASGAGQDSLPSSPSGVRRAPVGPEGARHAWVREREFPGPPCQPLHRVLWLAFCSAQYLARSNSLPPIESAFGLDINDPGNQGPLPAFARLPGGTLPARVTADGPGFLLLGVGTNLITKPLGPPFDRGYRAFEFEVSETNRLGSLLVPSAFAANYYRVVPQRVGPPRHELAVATRGKVRVLTPSERGPLLPPFRQATVVADYRFAVEGRARPAVRYTETKGGQWLSRSDPNLKMTIASKQSAVIGALPEESAAWRQRLFAGLLVTVALAPLAYLAARKFWRDRGQAT